jgi:drug/metabolite transporter (DMT)-like permease
MLKKEEVAMILLGYLIMCMVFGTTFLAIKVGIDAGLPPFMSAGLRFLIAGLVLYVAMVGMGKAKASILWRKEMLITGAGLTFGTFSTLYWAEQYVASGLAAVLSATGPMMILIIQTFVLHRKASVWSAIGCGVGFAGVILLVLPGLSMDGSLLWILGCAAVLLGELSYCAGVLYSKHVMPRFPETSPIALNAAQMMYGGALLLVLSLFTERAVDLTPLLTGSGAVSILYLIVVGSMVGHSLYYWLVAKTNPVFPSTWLYISPLIAMGLGVYLYNEAVTWVSVLGGVTIIVGIILVNAEVWMPMLGRVSRVRALKKEQHTSPVGN